MIFLYLRFCDIFGLIDFGAEKKSKSENPQSTLFGA